jgi:molybdopterin molybdotransferase
MVSIEEAQQIILERITLLETEKVSLFQGLNRVTTEDHIAPWDKQGDASPSGARHRIDN